MSWCKYLDCVHLCCVVLKFEAQPNCYRPNKGVHSTSWFVMFLWKSPAVVIRVPSTKLSSQNTNSQPESLKHNNAYVKEQLDLILFIFFLIQGAFWCQRARLYFPSFFPLRFCQVRMKMDLKKTSSQIFCFCAIHLKMSADLLIRLSLQALVHSSKLMAPEKWLIKVVASFLDSRTGISFIPDDCNTARMLTGCKLNHLLQAT